MHNPYRKISNHQFTNKQNKRNIIIRNATIDDIDGILLIDNEVYGQISDEVVASRSAMTERIIVSGSWFLLAEEQGKILGFLSLQPIEHGPEDFKSWDESTDGGTLKNSFCEEGNYVYGVALTVGKSSSSFDARDLLLFAGAKIMISENKKMIYLSGRMPSYHKHSNDITAEDYYNKKILKHGKYVALDPQIRMYESFGLKKVKLVENGFVGDRESCNYSVVFCYKNIFYNWPFHKFWSRLFGLIIKNSKLLVRR